MDGDRYLIKLVKNRPILWQKSVSTKNSTAAKETAWAQIAAKIGADTDWIKSRWVRLQGKFFNILKYDDEKMLAKFKYSEQMSFLAPSTSFNSSKNVRQPKSPEFVITINDLQAEDDVKVDIFEIIVKHGETENHSKEEVEYANQATKITDELIKETEAQDVEIDTTYHESQEENSSIQHVATHEMEVDVVENQFEKSPDENSIKMAAEKPVEESAEYLEPLVKNKHNLDLNKVKVEMDSERKEIQTKPAESFAPNTLERSEDTIFGELVAAMLKGMPDIKKKQVKKEIMCLLLS